MAKDDEDRANEMEAEREAEIEAEMERVGQNPEQVDDGTDSLGTQSAPSGEPRDRELHEPDDAAASQEESQELPNEQQQGQWEKSGGDAERSEEVLEADEDEEDEADADADAGNGDA